MHYSKSLLTIAVITALSLLPASAEKISPEQALSRLNSSMRVPSKLKAQKPALRLAKTVNTSSAEEAVYLFESQDNNSFVVMPADDLFPAVLGYGDSPLTDADGEMAPGLEWLLDLYAAEIEYVRQNPADADASTLIRTASASSATKEAIAPLIKTKWDQNAPFNNLVPYYGSNNKQEARSASGCVATALAQIMYYYKYPTKGTGSITYKYNYKTNQGINNKTSNTLTLNLSNTTFNWSSMLTDYSGNYTNAQAEAVATLMYACGVAVHARYGKSTSAKTVKDVGALGENFGYSSDMRYYYRDYSDFTADEWEDLIYGSLSRERPVIYSGGNDSSGHSFICDGYQGNHYFHFNWGWSGKSDGYFLLNGLDPKDQGTGGSDTGYNDRQLIITDIHPAESGETFEYMQLPLMGYNGSFTYMGKNTFQGDTTVSSHGFYNKSPQTTTFRFGIYAVGNGGIQDFIECNESGVELECGKGEAEMTFSNLNLENGNYMIYPAYLLEDSASGDTRASDGMNQIQIMAHNNDTAGYLEMHITNGTLSSGYNNKYDIITGIEESIADNENLQIRIAAGGEGVEISGVASKTLVSVYAADGMQVMPAVSINADTALDFLSLPGGVYILTATSADGTLSRRFLRR